MPPLSGLTPSVTQPPLLVWAESPRARGQVEALLAALERPALVGASVAETVAALLDHPRATVLLACFAGVPLTHAQAACRRFRTASAERRLRLLGLLEPGQMAQFDPLWGLDDLLALPASGAELAARLALLDWRERSADTPEMIKLGPLVIDALRHEVLVDNQPVVLTLREYELLVLLVSWRGRALSREKILEQVWGSDYYGGERTIDVHIRRLRAKLPPLAAAIETVHGLGYRFSPARLP